MAKASNFHLMGMVVQGDVGDWTIYTDRFGRKIQYPRQSPKDPPSYGREQVRMKFAAAQAAWAALTPEQHANLELAANRLSLVMTGQNLWISCSVKGNVATYATVAAQSGVDLPPLFVCT